MSRTIPTLGLAFLLTACGGGELALTPEVSHNYTPTGTCQRH